MPREEGSLEEAVFIAINSCRDVTSLGRFSRAVDPVRWVEEIQSHLQEALKRHERKSK